MNRTVEITIHEDVDHDFIQYDKDFKEWLAYAILWGNSDHVVIYVDKDKNIGASHRKKISEDLPPKQYFYMEGIYHPNEERKYTFHS